MIWAMAFPRINCNTTTVTVLAATAGTALPLCVCASRLNPKHKATTAGIFHKVCFPKQLDTGKPCVICQDKRTSQDRLDGRVCQWNGLSQEKSTPSVRGVCRGRVNVTLVALSPDLSQDQQTTAGKVMLMGLVEYMAALLGLLLPRS